MTSNADKKCMLDWGDGVRLCSCIDTVDLVLNKIGEYIRRILDCFGVQIGADGAEVCCS
jgi:hypothetical protein